MKNLILKTKYIILIFCFAALQSCDGEDGMDGAIGPQGEQGIAGPQGEQGIEGIPGPSGQDGNANVQTFTFDTSTKDGTRITLDLPELTQDVIDNDVILFYVTSSNTFSYAVPGPGPDGTYLIRTFLQPQKVSHRFHNWNGTAYSISIGDLLNAKVVIIESAMTTPKTKLSKDQILKDLKESGVDINDYEQVAKHFGLTDKF